MYQLADIGNLLIWAWCCLSSLWPSMQSGLNVIFIHCPCFLGDRKGIQHPAPCCMSWGNADLKGQIATGWIRGGWHAVFLLQRKTAWVRVLWKSGARIFPPCSIFTVCIWPREETRDNLFSFNIFLWALWHVIWFIILFIFPGLSKITKALKRLLF